MVVVKANCFVGCLCKTVVPGKYCKKSSFLFITRLFELVIVYLIIFHI